MDHTKRTTVREGEGRHRAGRSWGVWCADCGTWLGNVDLKRQASALTCPNASTKE